MELGKNSIDAQPSPVINYCRARDLENLVGTLTSPKKFVFVSENEFSFLTAVLLCTTLYIHYIRSVAKSQDLETFQSALDPTGKKLFQATILDVTIFFL